MPALGIVADDLTGAVDTANEVAARGYDTAVVAVPGTTPPDATVVGINTDSRYAPPSDAAATTRRSVDALGASVVYKKIDSTLRGHIGVEVAAALEATAAELAVVAPAFPTTDRTTWDGVHRVDGTPVAETAFAADINGPASSDVTALFADVGLPVTRVDGPEISRGVGPVATRFTDAVERHDQPPIVVCDARSESHLETIAAAGSRFNALFVGSGGLAAHLRLPASAAPSPGSPRPDSGAPLAVVGSVSDPTLEQLSRVPDGWLCHLDPHRLLNGTPAEAADPTGRPDDTAPTVLTAASTRSTVEETLAAGRDRGLSEAEIGGRIAAGLAAAAGVACRTTRPSGLFVTGGDVATAVLRELDATTVSLTGATAGAGIPVGRLCDGVVAGIPLITKAGGFGDQTTIVNCLDLLSPAQ